MNNKWRDKKRMERKNLKASANIIEFSFASKWDYDANLIEISSQFHRQNIQYIVLYFGDW